MRKATRSNAIIGARQVLLAKSLDRGDDTYDIDYDDGERETWVSKRLIRKKDRSRSRSGRLAAAVASAKGDKVRRTIVADVIIPGKSIETAVMIPTTLPTTMGARDRVASHPQEGREPQLEPEAWTQAPRGAKVQARYRAARNFTPAHRATRRRDLRHFVRHCAPPTRRVSRFSTQMMTAKSSRPRGVYQGEEGSATTASDDDDRGRGRMRVGDKIEARYEPIEILQGEDWPRAADGTARRNELDDPELISLGLTSPTTTGRRDARRGAPHPPARRRRAAAAEARPAGRGSRPAAKVRK